MKKFLVITVVIAAAIGVYVVLGTNTSLLTSIQSSLNTGTSTPEGDISAPEGGEVVGTSTLKMIFPNGTELFNQGSVVQIKWVSEFYPAHEPVQLTLNKGSNSSIIATTTQNDGQYEWVIPENLGNGDYSIGIMCILPPESSLLCNADASDSRFTVTSSEGPSVMIVYPTEGDELSKDDEIIINWATLEVPDEQEVTIELRDRATGTEVELMTTENDGAEKISLAEISPGIYFLTVKTTLNGVVISSRVGITLN